MTWDREVKWEWACCITSSDAESVVVCFFWSLNFYDYGDDAWWSASTSSVAQLLNMTGFFYSKKKVSILLEIITMSLLFFIVIAATYAINFYCFFTSNKVCHKFVPRNVSHLFACRIRKNEWRNVHDKLTGDQTRPQTTKSHWRELKV